MPIISKKAAKLRSIAAESFSALGLWGRDPGYSWRFYIEIQGLIVGRFLECGGITMEREIKEYQEGGVNDFVHKFPGRVKYSDITLKRGVSFSRELFEWFRKGIYDGKVERVNMSIILGNDEGLKVKQWDVFGAFPIKWQGPDMNTTAMQTSVETLVLAHHGVEMAYEEGLPLGLGFSDAGKVVKAVQSGNVKGIATTVAKAADKLNTKPVTDAIKKGADNITKKI